MIYFNVNKKNTRGGRKINAPYIKSHPVTHSRTTTIPHTKTKTRNGYIKTALQLSPTTLTEEVHYMAKSTWPFV